jgi:hypothetical protein
MLLCAPNKLVLIANYKIFIFGSKDEEVAAGDLTLSRAHQCFKQSLNACNNIIVLGISDIR